MYEHVTRQCEIISYICGHGRRGGAMVRSDGDGDGDGDGGGVWCMVYGVWWRVDGGG